MVFLSSSLNELIPGNIGFRTKKTIKNKTMPNPAPTQILGNLRKNAY